MAVKRRRSAGFVGFPQAAAGRQAHGQSRPDVLYFGGQSVIQHDEAMQQIAPTFSCRRPEGDDRDRDVCNHCGFVDYQNPRLVVGSVTSWTDPSGEPLVLLARRAIDPGRGLWSLPAGYLETHESLEQGAMREAMEEAGVEVELDAMLAICEIPHISQIQFVFRGALASPLYAAGPESLEVRLFAWRDIPWDSLAFPTIRSVLLQWRSTLHSQAFPPLRIAVEPPDTAASRRAGGAR